MTEQDHDHTSAWTQGGGHGSHLIRELDKRQVRRVSFPEDVDRARELNKLAASHDLRVAEIMRWLLDKLLTGEIDLDVEDVLQFRR